MGAQQSATDRGLIPNQHTIFPYLPGLIKNRIIWSIGEAERLKGSPPYTPEVTVVFQMNFTRWVPKGYLACFLSEFYREDAFYADKEFTVWSLQGPDGTKERETLEKFSDRFRRLYPGYELEPYGHIRACDSTPTINLKQLMALLK